MATGKTLRAIDSTPDGDHVWVCGGNGVVGMYDVVNRELRDYSKPNGMTSTWVAVTVSGASGSEHVQLGNSSGQFLAGDQSNCSMTWGSSSKPSGGNSIHGLDSHGKSEARLVGSSGQAYDTNDGGSTWTQIGIGSTGNTIYGVGSVSDTSASAGDSSGNIHEYDGSSWTATSVGSNAINDIVRDGSGGLAVGNGGLIVERTDGSWSDINPGTSTNLEGSALSSNNVYPDVAVGNYGEAYERGTHDGFNDTIAISDTEGVDTSYQFRVNGNVRSAGDTESSDDISSCSSDEQCYSVTGTVAAGSSDTYEFEGEISGFSVSSGSANNIDITLNGTKTSVERVVSESWSTPPLPVGKTLHSVERTVDGMFAVGGGGYVFKRTSSGWTTAVSDGPSSNGNTLYCSAPTDSEQYLWFGGSSGALGVYDVVNDNLTDHSAPNNLTSTWQAAEVRGFAGQERIYITNSSGKVVIGNSNIDGVDWSSPITPGDGSTLTGISFVSDSRGYVCDTNGKVFETEDGGWNWTEIGIQNPGASLYDIDAQAKDDITVAAGSGFYFTYDGDVWTKVSVGGNARRAVHRVDDRSFVVGGGGDIYKRLEFEYKQVEDAGSTTLYDVEITNDSRLPAVVVGNSGTVLEQNFSESVY